jgi:glycosyltransferase involved in cell wall biosynthesis
MTARLLYIVTNADLAGAPMHVLSLASHFVRTFEVHCVVGDKGPLCDALKANGVEVTIIPTMRSAINVRLDLASLFALKRLILRAAPDLIHAHSSKAGFIARLAGLFTRTPVIFTAHGWGFAPGTPLLQKSFVWTAEALSATASARVICVSEYDESLARRWLPFASSRLTTIRHGIPDIPLVASPQRQPPRISMVARVSGQKDHALAIEAFSRLKSDSALLRLIGEGTRSSELQGLLASVPQPVRSRVECLGSREDVARLLADSEIFVLFSKYEGLPLTIIEAMRAGLPVLASDVGGVRELVSPRRNGLLVPRDDLAAAVEALQFLVDHPQERAKLGAAGRMRYLSEFGEQRMLSSTERVYRDALVQ